MEKVDYIGSILGLNHRDWKNGGDEDGIIDRSFIR